MHQNLSEYLRILEQEGELVRITAQVDSQLEVAELIDRESKRPGGGRALLFEKNSSDFPIAANLMGSDRRIALALGVDSLDELTQRVEGLFAELTAPKPNFMDKLRMLPLLGEVSRWFPKQKRGKGACQEVIWRGEEADLGRLPILQCWPHDGGRFVTLPLVNTLDPDTGVRNVGMYRMQLFDGQTTGMHWHLHKTGERHYRSYQKQGNLMPVAVCLGGDPAYTYAATAPMPDNMDEYLLAGFLRQRPVELVHCLTHDLWVPADCDFVIEGYVDPAEEKTIEGPFGDHTGFYSLEDRYPLFHVTAITHRRGAIYPATLVGVPPQEDCYIAKATEKIFLAPIRRAMLPEVRDLFMPMEGVAHNLAIVDIERSYVGQGFKVASSMWGAGQMMFNKFMVVTSSDRSIRDATVLPALLRRVEIPRNLLFSRGPLDVLDHTAPEMGFGGKLAIDLTEVKLTQLPESIHLPDHITLSYGVTHCDHRQATEWGVLFLSVTEGYDVAAWLKANAISGIRFIILLDDVVDTATLSDVLWLIGGNCDPIRDTELIGSLLLLDARSKVGGMRGFARRWPEVVTAAPHTIALVDSRWAEYGLGAFTPSPSLRYQKLLHSDASGASVEPFDS